MKTIGLDKFGNRGTEDELRLIALLRFVERHGEFTIDSEGHLRLNKPALVKNFLKERMKKKDGQEE